MGHDLHQDKEHSLLRHPDNFLRAGSCQEVFQHPDSSKAGPGTEETLCPDPFPVLCTCTSANITDGEFLSLLSIITFGAMEWAGLTTPCVTYRTLALTCYLLFSILLNCSIKVFITQ